MRLASLNEKSCGWKTRDYTGMTGYLEFRSREPILPSGERYFIILTLNGTMPLNAPSIFAPE